MMMNYRKNTASAARAWLGVLWLGTLCLGLALPARGEPGAPSAPVWTQDYEAGWNQLAAGQYDPAIDAFVRVWAALESHPEEKEARVLTAFGMGVAWSHKHQYENALQWHRQGMSIARAEYGEAHPLVATAIDNIATVYRKQGKITEALEWSQKALDIYRKTAGETHLDTATAWNNLAMLHVAQKDYPQALEGFQRALAILEALKAEEDGAYAMMATLYDNIADVRQRQGDPAGALEWSQKAVALYEQTLGDQHPETAIAYMNRAAIHETLRQPEPAISLYRKALRIFSARLGKQHSDTQKVQTRLRALEAAAQ
jgi:tetratricopeptide (TPR) repeat protein